MGVANDATAPNIVRGASMSSVGRSVRRGKVSLDRKLGYARLQGTGRGTLDHRVRKKSVTIGRLGGGADCQLNVESRTVSRLHARLIYAEEEQCWMIHCLSKKNGVLVDGVPTAIGMPPLPLKSRQLIELGDAAIYFLEPKPPLIFTHSIEKTERDIQRKRKAKEEAAARQKKKPKRTAVPRRTQSRARGTGATASSGGTRKRRARATTGRKVGGAAAARGASRAKSGRARAGGGSGARGGAGKRKSGGEGRSKESGPTDVWTKKEKSEFLRAIFASGVKKIGEDEFEWSQFRANAGGLPNKRDSMLKDYYDRLMKDVELLVEAANRSKKESGRSRRTKHKESCECVICEHSRKKAARIAAGNARPDDLKPPAAKVATEAAAKAAAEATGDGQKEEEETSKKPADIEADAARDEAVKNALVGLVTAQKLRVRLGLIDAANSVNTPAGVAAIARLSSQPVKPQPSGESLPEWWKVGKHDRELMMGVANGGVGKWSAVWNDPTLEGFAEIVANSEELPNDRAAMRRFREVSSAILTEKRRRARRSTTSRAPARRRPAQRKTAAAAKPAQSFGRSLKRMSSDEYNSDYQDETDDASEEDSDDDDEQQDDDNEDAEEENEGDGDDDADNAEDDDDDEEDEEEASRVASRRRRPSTARRKETTTSASKGTATARKSTDDEEEEDEDENDGDDDADDEDDEDDDEEEEDEDDDDENPTPRRINRDEREEDEDGTDADDDEDDEDDDDDMEVEEIVEEIEEIDEEDE